MDNQKIKKTLNVALIGEPNAGKSSLLNAIIGEKVSIVTHKVQTTRFNIRGILCEDDTQVIFTDTPGIFKPEKRLEKAIVRNALNSFDQADILCLILDVKHFDLNKLTQVQAYLKKSSKPCYAIINKIDLIARVKLLEIIKKLDETLLFKELFMVSATKGEGVANLINFLKKQAHPGPWLYEEDQLTDQPARVLAEESTREQVFLLLHEELPYSIKIETDQWQDCPDGSIKIYQSIYVLKEQQKVIVLGANGSKIKDIGRRSRQQISNLLDKTVHLFLHVKVREEWIDKDYRAIH